MIQHLYWLEPEEKWQSRGYANNLHLMIDYDRKEYEFTTEMVFPHGSDNEIVVNNKGSLKSYVGYLQKNEFLMKV